MRSLRALGHGAILGLIFLSAPGLAQHPAVTSCDLTGYESDGSGLAGDRK